MVKNEKKKTNLFFVHQHFSVPHFSFTNTEPCFLEFSTFTKTIRPFESFDIIDAMPDCWSSIICQNVVDLCYHAEGSLKVKNLNRFFFSPESPVHICLEQQPPSVKSVVGIVSWIYIIVVILDVAIHVISIFYCRVQKRIVSWFEIVEHCSHYFV